MIEFIFVDDSGNYTDAKVDGTYEIRTSLSSAAIGDLVYESTLITNGVDTVVDNNDSRSVIGIIVDKPSSTAALVCTSGKIESLSGFDKGYKVYLSNTGNITSNQPNSDYLQVLGHAVDVDVIDFYPVNTKIRRHYVV